MPIYTIALGTPDGVVEVQDQFGQLQELQVPPDTETLKQVADMTGGKFFDAPSAEDLAAVYESLGSKVGFTDAGPGGDPVVRRRCAPARDRRRRPRRRVVQSLPVRRPSALRPVERWAFQRAAEDIEWNTRRSG